LLHYSTGSHVAHIASNEDCGNEVGQSLIKN